MTDLSRTLFAPFALVLIMLVACGQQSPNELVMSAKTYLDKGESKAAIIQLKQALDQNGSLGEARFLLGKVLLDTGDATSAIIELRKAQELSYPANDVVPLLAKALLVTQQYQLVADEFDATQLPSPGSYADLKTTVATAYASLNNQVKAKSAIQAALTAVPDFPATLALQARMAGFEQRSDDAMALIAKVLAVTPNDPQAWFLKGELLQLGNNDRIGAAEAFRKALTIQPAHADARSALISVLIGQRDLKGAAEQVVELRKTLPNHPQTKLFEAQLALANGEIKNAMELIELAQKAAPDSLQVLQMAGTIQLANGSLLQAERSFSRALTLKTKLPAVRRLLAQTLLRMGQPSKALASLQPLIATGDESPQTFALAGEAHLQSGDLDRSRANFERAVKLDPTNSLNLTRLAVAKQKTAGIEATATELQKIAAADKGTNADLALISLLLKSKELDRTLAAIDAVEVKLPKNPLPANLRGHVYLLRKDLVSARASFEQALAIDPVFVPAVTSLATLDLQDKNPAGARLRFEAVLKVDPKNLDALLATAKLRTIDGSPKSEIASLLAKAVQLNPSELAPRLLLIDLYLDQRDFKAALNAAQEASTALPDQVDLVDALGRSQLAAGETQQAISTFNRLAALEPKSTRPFMRLAAAQLTTDIPAAAEQSLGKALSLAPNYLAAQQALIKIALAGQRPTEALAIARTVQQQRPNETTGQDMEAAIEASRNNPNGVVEVYRRALKKYPVSIMAVKLHSALRGAQPAAEADKMADSWIADHPKDAGFPAYLGDLAMVQGKYDLAEKHFRRVAALRPDNAESLNNIAICMLKQNKPGAATFAEQALKLSPNTPGMMDTLASALAADKQLPKALTLQKQALKIEPDNQMLRLNLAKLHILASDKPAALAELKTLEKAGAQFRAQPEVARLLNSL